MTCPICKKIFEPPALTFAENHKVSATLPFCSLRCRDVDLGRWFDGKYQVDAEELDESMDVLETTTPPAPTIRPPRKRST